MNHLFVCEWETVSFETDDDGEEYNHFSVIDYTTHYSLEEAQAIAQQNYIGYGLATGKIKDKDDEDYWEPAHCSTILEYQNHSLFCKHVQNDHDGWRVYPILDHWKDNWPNLISYPPFIQNHDEII